MSLIIKLNPSSIRTKMKAPKLMQIAIESTRNLARMGDSPMAYIKTKDKKIIMTVLAISSKSAIKMTLYTLAKSQDTKEVVMVNEAWYVSEDKGKLKGKNRKDMELEVPVSQDPRRKECFIVSYFSPKKSLMKQMPYKRIKKRNKEVLKWEKTDGKDNEVFKGESAFNPFEMTEEEVKEYSIQAEIDIIKERGKKEVYPMLFDRHIDIYRHKGRVYFEGLRKDGQVFISIKPMDDDEKFASLVEDMKEKLKEMETIFK